MADVDIDLFGDHNKTDSHPDVTGENIPFTPGGVIEGSTWEPEREQETFVWGNESENGSSQRTRKSIVSCAI